jgi:sialate O-acetylesterase
MMVTAERKIIVQDVLVGEVWVASGQSNMGFPLGGDKFAKTEIPASDNQLLRHFGVSQKSSATPEWDVQGKWEVASPATVAKFTAVGYYFGKKLQKELSVPVGIIRTSWGGSVAQAWTSPAALATVPEMKATYEDQWSKINNYQSDKANYKTKMQTWLKAEGREEQPTPEMDPYLIADVTSLDWYKVKIPGLVKTAGLPNTGVIWLRKTFQLQDIKEWPAIKIAIDGSYAIYLNGVKVKEVNISNTEGVGDLLVIDQKNCGASILKVGDNVLSIRLHQVSAPINIHGPLTVGSLSITGEWSAKAELAYPDLTPAKLATLPQLLALPPVVQVRSGALFNAMVNPLIPYAISGVVWYQGESNKPNAWQYRTAFPLLINDWRKQWQQGDFPFYFCQVPGHYDKKSKPEEDPGAELREAQAQGLLLPNTGMTVNIDLGEVDIHPKNKRDVGERLANLVLAKNYGKKFPFSGPIYDSRKKEGSKIVLSFKHTEGGLVARDVPTTHIISGDKTAPLVRNSPDSQLEGFSVCGSDKRWVWASAKIVGEKVEVWSDKVSDPLEVRYAWSINPTCNLFNGDGLPAAPFRTDDFPAKTLGVKF